MNPNKAKGEDLDRLVKRFGTDTCLTAVEDLATYGFDAGHDKGCLPLAVVFATSTADVADLVRFCRKRGLALIPRGAGSGLTGGSVPVQGGIVLCMSRMNRIIELDPANLCAVVEPGVVTADLQAEAQKQGLFYPPDPASQEFCTIGGNIAENAGGMRAVKYGVTKNYVMGLEVVLADGRIITLGSKCIKDVAGYSLAEIFVGSEGTLGIVTRAIVRLVPLPETIETLAICFDSMPKAGQVVPQILQSGILPCTLEFIDKTCLEAVRKAGLMEGCEAFVHEKTQAMLLVELDGRSLQVAADADQVQSLCADNGMLSFCRAGSRQERELLWHVRRSIHGALGLICTQWMEEDVSVPRSAIPDMLDVLMDLARKENLIIPCFGHYGDGNIHLSVTGSDGPLDTARTLAVKKHIFSQVSALGGRIAAEHGIGLAKKDYLGINLTDDTLGFSRDIKQMLDPQGLMNPGKVFPG